MTDRNDYLYSTPVSESSELYAFPTSSSLLITVGFPKLIATCESSIEKATEGCFVALKTNQVIRTGMSMSCLLVWIFLSLSSENKGGINYDYILTT